MDSAICGRLTQLTWQHSIFIKLKFPVYPVSALAVSTQNRSHFKTTNARIQTGRVCTNIANTRQNHMQKWGRHSREKQMHPRKRTDTFNIRVTLLMKMYNIKRSAIDWYRIRSRAGLSTCSFFTNRWNPFFGNRSHSKKAAKKLKARAHLGTLLKCRHGNVFKFMNIFFSIWKKRDFPMMNYIYIYFFSLLIIEFF